MKLLFRIYWVTEDNLITVKIEVSAHTEQHGHQSMSMAFQKVGEKK